MQAVEQTQSYPHAPDGKTCLRHSPLKLAPCETRTSRSLTSGTFMAVVSVNHDTLCPIRSVRKRQAICNSRPASGRQKDRTTSRTQESVFRIDGSIIGITRMPRHSSRTPSPLPPHRALGTPACSPPHESRATALAPTQHRSFPAAFACKPE